MGVELVLAGACPERLMGTGQSAEGVSRAEGEILGVGDPFQNFLIGREF
jgi:hypothetical protein